MTTPRQVNNNSHFKSPFGNGGIICGMHETVINIIAARRNFRFRAASCAVPEHSTYYTTAHRLVAATSFGAEVTA